MSIRQVYFAMCDTCNACSPQENNPEKAIASARFYGWYVSGDRNLCLCVFCEKDIDTENYNEAPGEEEYGDL